MPIQNKPPKSQPTSRTSADVIHYGKVFRPYGPEWVKNGLTSHVPVPTIIELIHQNIPAKRNTDLTSLKKSSLVSILMKFYDKTNNTGKKRIEQWVYTHRYRRKIQFENPFVEKINKFLNHLKTFESPKFTVTPATASKIFNELTITGITSLSEVRSVLKSNIVKSSTQEKAFNPIFNEWFSSDLSKYTNSPSRVKIIPDSLSALDPNDPSSSQQSQSSDDIESLLTEFRQIVSGAGNSEGEYIPNEASNEHTESPETPQDPNNTDDFEDEDLEDEPPEPPEKLESKSDTSPPSSSSPDSDKEDESNSPEEDEKDEEQNSKSESDSSENDEDSDEEPEPNEPEDDSGETSDSSDETEPKELEDEEPPEDETSNSNSETDEEKDEDSGDSSKEKDESEEDSSDEKEENNEEETESDKDEEPQQDGESESTTEPLRERPLVKEQVKDMILRIANSEDSTIDELRHHTKEQLNIT